MLLILSSSSPSFLPHPCPAGSHQGTQLNSANLQKFEFEIFIYLLSDKGGQRFIIIFANLSDKKNSHINFQATYRLHLKWIYFF